MLAVDSAESATSFGYRVQTVDISEFSSSVAAAQISVAVFTKAAKKAGAEGAAPELVQAILEMKRHNPSWGCPQIAEQINLAFGTSINKDVVRRILAVRHPPTIGDGPSWLTFIGHMKDSLWSLDLFPCESIALQTYWVLVVMDQYSRRIVGFGIQRGVVDGMALCRMFSQAIQGAGPPKYLSSDHDPLYRFHQWEANLRILDVTGIKTVPYAPWSHAFVERLIGTIRRERLDRLLFWTATDLETKLIAFRDYYNGYRCHAGLKGETPVSTPESRGAYLKSYGWKPHCRGLFQTPIAA